ncbi:MAG: Xylulose kinase [Planctomycetes bacterium ADurb.Bin401]|nr:MAG: Xylulose kinase [Planctomycetes bacterium ADurb.Bin401]
MNYILGIDLGTSYFKFGIYDEHLNCDGLGRVTVEKNTGKGNLSELPAERFISLIKEGIKCACEQAGISPDEISKISYASQANSFILLDKCGTPLTNLILWPDTRANEIYPEVKKLWNEKDFLTTTGIGIQPSSQLCINKLLWFKKNEPETWQKTSNVLTISDYLIFIFTGKKVGDMGTASLLGLLDCQAGKWWHKAFDILNIDAKLFGPRLPVAAKAGEVNKQAENMFGTKCGTSFYIGSLDHHMAALGAGAGRTADISESTGTVLACVDFTNAYKPREDVCISPWVENNFCQLTFDGNGALSLEWYHQHFAQDYPIAELIEMAQKTGNAAGLRAKPMAYKYKSLNEAFVNLNENHTHGHFIYALMESAANTLKELINKLTLDKTINKIAATGGGAKSDLWLQVKAKITNCDFQKVQNTEPATLGAAMITKSYKEK